MAYMVSSLCGREHWSVSLSPAPVDHRAYDNLHIGSPATLTSTVIETNLAGWRGKTATNWQGRR